MELTQTQGQVEKENKVENNKGIGPSECVVLMYLSKKKSPVELYLEKTGEIEVEPKEESAWSKEMKEVLANQFTREKRLFHHKKEMIKRHPEHDFMVGVVDYTVEEEGKEGLLDIRRVNEYRRKEFEDGKTPMDFIVRIQHNLAVFGWDFAHLVVLIGGTSIEYRRIERDPVIIDQIIEAERLFWNHVEEKKMVPMDGSKAATEWLNQRFAEANKEAEIELPKESMQLIEELEQVKAEEQELKEKRAELENKLKFFLGENATGRIGSRVVKWTPVVSTKFDQKALAKEHPEIYQKFTLKTTYRRFSFK